MGTYVDAKSQPANPSDYGALLPSEAQSCTIAADSKVLKETAFHNALVFLRVKMFATKCSASDPAEYIDANGQCQPCAKGNKCDGTAQMGPCESGSFAASEGMVECEPCAGGSFQLKEEST